MLKADEMLYKPLKPLNQGQTSMCTAYAFFSLLGEFLEQKYDLKVEFDIPLYFEMMEANRGRKLRIKYLIERASKKGYKTTTGECVKIIGKRSLLPTQRNSTLRLLQVKGPILFGIKRWYGHSLNNKVLKMPEEDSKLKKSGYLMYLNGFYEDGYYFQNSYGKKHQKIPFEVYEYITKYAFSIFDVTIQ